MNNPKVSIITPCYNDEKYISETISSVLNQSYSNLELLIIDDCSSDQTASIIKSFNNPRIVYIRNEKNMGAAYNRNLGIKKSTGDYIAFLDGDDIWSNDKLEKQIKFMIENNYDFTCTNFGIIDSNGNKTNKYVTAPEIMNHKTFLKTNYVGCLTIVYKKSVFPDLEIPTTILKRNDWALWVKLSERCDCYLLDECLAYYRKRGESSISSGKKSRLFKYHIQVYKDLYGFSSFKGFFYAIRNVIFYIYRLLRYRKTIK